MYDNVTDRTISLRNCGGVSPLHLEKREDEGWVRAWDPPMELCPSPPIEILPGEAFKHTLYVFGAHPDATILPRFAVDEVPGTYRIVIISTYWPPIPTVRHGARCLRWRGGCPARSS